MIEKALPLPSHQPDYRVNRSHSDFLMNLKVPPHLLKAALLRGWDATGHFTELPLDQVGSLASAKYALDAWNYRF